MIIFGLQDSYQTKHWCIPHICKLFWFPDPSRPRRRARPRCSPSHSSPGRSYLNNKIYYYFMRSMGSFLSLVPLSRGDKILSKTRIKYYYKNNERSTHSYSFISAVTAVYPIPGVNRITHVLAIFAIAETMVSNRRMWTPSDILARNRISVLKQITSEVNRKARNAKGEVDKTRNNTLSCIYMSIKFQAENKFWNN